MPGTSRLGGSCCSAAKPRMQKIESGGAWSGAISSSLSRLGFLLYAMSIGRRWARGRRTWIMPSTSSPPSGRLRRMSEVCRFGARFRNSSTVWRRRPADGMSRFHPIAIFKLPAGGLLKTSQKLWQNRRKRRHSRGACHARLD